MTVSDDDDAARCDREAILARRQRFIVAAIAGLTTSTLATACRPKPCLRVAPIEALRERDAERRAGPQEQATESLVEAKAEATGKAGS